MISKLVAIEVSVLWSIGEGSYISRLEVFGSATSNVLFERRLGLVAIVAASVCGRRLQGVPEPQALGSSIGGLIRNLLLVQAALCSVQPTVGCAIAVVLVLAWPLNRWLARRFYAT